MKCRPRKGFKGTKEILNSSLPLLGTAGRRNVHERTTYLNPCLAKPLAHGYYDVPQLDTNRQTVFSAYLAQQVGDHCFGVIFVPTPCHGITWAN